MATLIGTTGDDNLYGGSSADSIYGDAGHDVILGGGGADTINGGGGDDSLYGGNGSDSLYGADGNDYSDGGSGNDSIDGGIGHDTLGGGVGNDTIAGGDGNDVIEGEDGNDSINAGAGDDTMGYYNGGNDTFIGGAGYDVLYLEDDSAGVWVTDVTATQMLINATYVLNIDSTLEKIVGTDFADYIYAPSNILALDGGAGNDTLRASDGQHLIGGAGSDVFGFDDDTPTGTVFVDDFVVGTDHWSPSYAHESIHFANDTIGGVAGLKAWHQVDGYPPTYEAWFFAGLTTADANHLF